MVKGTIFVIVVFFIMAIPSLFLLWLLSALLFKFGASRLIFIVCFSTFSSFSLSPLMLPAASIMVMPGPSLIVFADILLGNNAEYFFSHLGFYPVFTPLSFIITFLIGGLVGNKVYLNKSRQATQ